jgi:hypothetical protein
MFVGVAVGGLILVQRLVPLERRQAHNDVAGFIYAVLGVAYAVLLGLMLIAVWEDYQEAQIATTEEANELSAIFWIADGLPEPQAEHVQELAREYTSVVVQEEWPLMAQGRSSPRAWQTLDDLRASVEDMHPKDDAQLVLYDNEIQRLHDLGDARRARMLQVHEGLPTILWVVLLVGGMVEVGFTYLFGLRSTTVHVLMVAALAMIIGLVLFTIGALEFPFKGDVRVSPEAFESLLDRFNDSK